MAIIGAGFGGLGAAVALRRAGIDDLVIIEGDDGVGGTWRRNTYPGAACDIQSHLYSFSFAPNKSWSRTYARQPEILSYLESVVDDFGSRSPPHAWYHRSVCLRWRDGLPKLGSAAGPRRHHSDAHRRRGGLCRRSVRIAASFPISQA